MTCVPIDVDDKEEDADTGLELGTREDADSTSTGWRHGAGERGTGTSFGDRGGASVPFFITAIPLAIREASRIFWISRLRVEEAFHKLPPPASCWLPGDNLNDGDVELWSFSSQLPQGTTVRLDWRPRTAVSDVARFAIEHRSPTRT
jgi:hypothetical protein